MDDLDVAIFGILHWGVLAIVAAEITHAQTLLHSQMLAYLMGIACTDAAHHIEIALHTIAVGEAAELEVVIAGTAIDACIEAR